VRKALKAKDPYMLRKRGLDERLEPYELGRALFHLNQRRGFQSNRKQAVKDKDAGIINDASKKLPSLLEERACRTYGEFLFSLSAGKGENEQHLLPSKRIRNASLEANKALYAFYPLRDMLKKEYDALMAAQARYHPILLTPEMVGGLKNIMFHQRPLKPVKKGRCSLLPKEERAYSALPSSQRFRILKEANNLEILDKVWRRNRNDLTDEQRQKVISELYKKKTVSFEGLRKSLRLDSSSVFNLESEHREKLEGATTHIALSKPECFGKTWNSLSLSQQDDIVGRLLDDALPNEELIAWLKEKFVLDDANIKTIMDVPLADGTLKFSSQAIHQLIPYLENGKNEYEAIIACGWQHANRYTGEVVEELPYYGKLLETHVAFGTGNVEDGEEKRYGKIPNPTVHIVLNQVRTLMNELISTYGRPVEIALELARDLKLNTKEKARLEKEIRDNTKANERYDTQIVAAGLQPSPDFRLRLKLHEQQAGLCAYSGRTITVAELLSDRVEVDHILPFSRTFDDTAANKVVVFREYNRLKENKSPYEAKAAFEKAGIEYEGMLARTSSLPGSKKWRFLPDAMQRFEEEKQSGDQGWLGRQLTDTSYMARVAREYLRYVVGDRVQGFPAVDTYPGGVTAKLRRGWGLNSLLHVDPDDAEKNRTDHRHHAIDARVIACANRSMLKKISDASARGEAMDEAWTKDLVSKAPPYVNFDRAALQTIVDRIVISHKPDHGRPGKGDSGGTTSRLHEETYYGLAKNQEDLPADKIRLLVRIHLKDLREKDIGDICDLNIRRALAYAVGQRPKGEKPEEAIMRFGRENNIRRVRVFVEKSRKAMKAIKDKEGRPYRYVATGGNHHLDIFCPIKDKWLEDGTKYRTGRWYAETVSHFDANQKGFEPQWRKIHPTAKLIMRLHINDMVAFDNNEGRREIWRVRMLDAYFDAPHIVPHKDCKDHQSRKATAKQLQEWNARKIAVTPAGKVLDPGKAPMPKPLLRKEAAAA
jgi:CRISPR-associated endonuclease Csn1